MSNPEKLPPFEDIVDRYIKHTMSKLFPKHCDNKWFVYTVGFFHLLGTMILSYGVLLPNNIMPLYLVYCCINALLYYLVFNKRCFMTLLTNYYGNVKGTALHIKMDTAYFGLGVNMVLAIIAIISPKYSLFSFLGRYFSC